MKDMTPSDGGEWSMRKVLQHLHQPLEAMSRVLTVLKHAFTFVASTVLCKNSFSTLKNIFTDHWQTMLHRRKANLFKFPFEKDLTKTFREEWRDNIKISWSGTASPTTLLIVTLNYFIHSLLGRAAMWGKMRMRHIHKRKYAKCNKNVALQWCYSRLTQIIQTYLLARCSMLNGFKDWNFFLMFLLNYILLFRATTDVKFCSTRMNELFETLKVGLNEIKQVA